MADDVTLPGTGAVVSTDDIGGSHRQRIKVTLGPDGTATADLAGRDVGNSEGGALYVDQRQKCTVLTVTSSGLTTATTTYVSGDQMGTEITAANAVRQSGLSGTVVHATLLDKKNVVGAVDLYVFAAATTPAADNAANAWSDADAANLLAIVEFAYPKASGNNRLAHAINLPVKIVPAATSLFCDFVTRAAHTFFDAGGDLIAKLYIEQD